MAKKSRRRTGTKTVGQARTGDTAETTSRERTGSLGFETKLWEAADLLRNNMDPAEYKHVVLGLLFLHHLLGHR